MKSVQELQIMTENLNKKYKIKEDEGYIDIIKIAKDLGFVIGIFKIKYDYDSFLVIDEKYGEILGVKTNKLIGINRNRSLEFKRYLIALEIGRYFLDYLEHSIEFEGFYTHIRYERESPECLPSVFARNLLMPEILFQQKFKEMKENHREVEDIAKDFLLPYFLVLHRIRELRLEER